MKRSLVLIGSLLALAACYRTVPVEGGTPAVGREVVLELTDRGSVELAPQLGAQLKSVAGRVSSFENQQFNLAVSQTTSRSGIETLWRGENAVVPLQYVNRTYERRVDKKRSWLVAGLTVVGVVVAGEAFGINTGLDGLFGGGGKGSRK